MAHFPSPIPQLDIKVGTRVYSIVDWFDPEKLEHLEAYQYLQKFGEWPQHFIPADVRFPVSWQLLLSSRLANEYVAKEWLSLTGKTLR